MSKQIVKLKPVTEVIADRQMVHGDFRDVAKKSQEFQAILRDGKNWDDLPDHQKEGLLMICHKVARILSGDPNHLDHWQDICGYAARVASYL
jgi:hypothetical protein